ncbi:hypothetical protein [Ruania rhizosphaerae]|uniref:hypothetical protein n=1 Tax=Ruania rhizosphaerae TaxID=1840413 RepID=UPI001357B6AC|nr:hypothetical protein [Ruania rhizosphaerae]
MASVLLSVAVVTGCSDGDPSPSQEEAPRPLTSEELDRLAVSRFVLYQTETVEVQATVSGQQPVTFNGWVDVADGLGYGVVVTPNGGQGGAFLTAWTDQEVSAQDTSGTSAPLPPPESGWQTMPLDPDTSTLAAAQVLLVSLAADRPENSQLLAQNGAQWLGAGTVDGVVVDIMSGPVEPGASGGSSSFRYWIDDDGSLLRVEAMLDGVAWSTFDLTPAQGVDL